MNSFEINKFAGALLVAVLTMTIISFIGNFLIPEGGEGGGQAEHVAARESAAPAPAAEAKKSELAKAPAAAPPAAQAPIAARLAQANVEAGAKLVKKCLGCHSIARSGRNKVGPGLWGVVGRAKGAAEGFRYSAGLKAKGGDWGYADLDVFLANPKSFVAKTKMTFKVKNPEDRAALILYLRTLAGTPAPLPGR